MPDWVAGGDAASDSFLSDCDDDMKPDTGTAGHAASPSGSAGSELSDWDEVIPDTAAASDTDYDFDLTAESDCGCVLSLLTLITDSSPCMRAISGWSGCNLL